MFVSWREGWNSQGRFLVSSYVLLYCCTAIVQSLTTACSAVDRPSSNLNQPHAKHSLGIIVLAFIYTTTRATLVHWNFDINTSITTLMIGSTARTCTSSNWHNPEHASHSSSPSSWPTSDRVRPSKQTLLLNSRPTSSTVLHFHLWIQTLAMTAPMCRYGSRRSQTNKEGNDCTAPLLVVSVLGRSQVGEEHSAEALLMLDVQILQYRWIQGRMDSLKFRLISNKSEERWPSGSAETGRLHGRGRPSRG